jgi:ABC-type dipeptide/oligopeptide/nickel transport system ATPase component
MLNAIGLQGIGAGRFVEVGPAEQVLQHPKEAYTRELLSAVPELPRA